MARGIRTNYHGFGGPGQLKNFSAAGILKGNLAAVLQCSEALSAAPQSVQLFIEAHQQPFQAVEPQVMFSAEL